MKSKIVVVIRGGVLEGVFASPEIEIERLVVLDYDNRSHGDEFDEEQIIAEAEIEGKLLTEVL